MSLKGKERLLVLFAWQAAFLVSGLRHFYEVHAKNRQASDELHRGFAIEAAPVNFVKYTMMVGKELLRYAGWFFPPVPRSKK